MKAHTKPLAGALGMALGMTGALAFATPAAAASMPQAPAAPMTGSALVLADGFSSSSYNPAAQTADWRRCGFFGCRRGWRGRGWRGRRGVSAGDIIAGAVVIGGIAAIASAASNNRRRDREVVVVERDRRVDDRRTTTRSNPRSTGSNGLDNAVSQCLREIERDVRVDTVDGASRVSSGWVVTGSIFDGSGFSCEIGNDGRISDIQYGGFRSSAGETDGGGRALGQRSDDFYASARASMNGEYQTYSTAERFADAGAATGNRPAQPLVPLTSDRMPAYPGGPIPGEDIDE